MEMLETFLLQHCKDNILQILQDENIEKHFSVNISFVELFENDTSLGNKLLKEPETAFIDLDNWVLHIEDLVFQKSPEKDKLLFKQNLHARIYGLSAHPELHRTVFPRNKDINSFLQITGTVVKTKDPRMLEYQRAYCCSKCKDVQMINANYSEKYIIEAPRQCSNSESCPGKNFISLGGLSVENCKDYQEIKIQEKVSNLSSTMPSSLWVTLEDDLVDICKPGDDITISGIVKRRWNPLQIGKQMDAELAFKANHVQVHNGNTVPTIITFKEQDQFDRFWKKYEKSPLEGRNIILKSFCPKLCGMYLVKLAMAIVLAGGSNKYGSESATQRRSESHILLVGDPGTGKSQLLRYSSKIISRSVLTTGIGTTSAGLTVAAAMEDGHWQLEAGALVLADGGICCIDEFNSMKPHDRASIHEAMEQQSVSVAKAGIHCKLRTRCAIIAATNPKGGHLDSSQSLSLNLAIPSPLLSRFDVVLMLKDAYQLKWDSEIATHILGGKNNDTKEDEESTWSLKMLQQYFVVVKTINPKLSLEADQILAAYYQAQRQEFVRNKSRTTVRLLESLIRLSQGHAKLMYHREVRVMDAIFAIIIIESSMHGECAALSLGSLNILESFPDNAMQNYVDLANKILNQLGLNDILRTEIEFLKNTCTFEVKIESNKAFGNRSDISDIDEPLCSSTQSETTKNEKAAECSNSFNITTAVNKVDTGICDLNKYVKNHGPTDNETNNSNDSSHLGNAAPINSFLNVNHKVNQFRENQKVENKIKRKRFSTTNNEFNMLNLLPSVSDDFHANEDSIRIEDSQNTVNRKVYKKFKFIPKAKLQMEESNATESESKGSNLHQNTEENRKSINEIIDYDFDEQNERSDAHNPESLNLSKANSTEIQNKDKVQVDASKDLKNYFKSRFGFVPPPPNEIPENELNNVKTENDFCNESIFENEDINLDFLDIDI
ncbi:hypothetical protein FQR65_LT09101 [Abscondita terminalis]|nr:hypothetical protein FQR65_LT09101 [Abscondita terminalis]